MTYFVYLPHLLLFTVGTLLGLQISYRWHSEPFALKKIEPIPLALAIIGGVLTVFYVPLGLLFIGFVIGMRPGYGFYESIIGILLAVILWVVI